MTQEIHQCERCGLILEGIFYNTFQVHWSKCVTCKTAIESWTEWK